MDVQLNEVVGDAAHLRAAMREADLVPLLLVLAHLSGDEAILDEAAPYIHGAWNFMHTMPDDLQAKVRDRLARVLAEYDATGRALPATPPAHLLRKMLNVGVGQEVPEEYVPLLLEEMRLGEADPRSVPWRARPPAEILAGFRAVIIGAGLSGLCMAIKLREAGIPFTIIEKNPTVGGTWYENDYPGCGVDTPNHFFSYSFAPNHDWPEHFSKRNDLWSYLERCADQYDVRRDITFNTEVTAARWDAARARWAIELRDGGGEGGGAVSTLEANVLITAVGQLNRPSIPDIPGLNTFAGPVFHTGRWDHTQSVAGKRVAMIGTGASGMQTGPSIAPEVEHLTIFQRTPHWSVHNPNYHARVSPGKIWALKHIPFYDKWYRFLLFWASSDGLHASLQIDPDWPTPDRSLNATNQQFRELLTAHITKELGGRTDLLAKVIPPYPPYGKRMLRDNHWYRMLTRPNVELVTERIDRIDPDAIVTRDGARHPADMIVLATGFQAGRMLWPMETRGRAGDTLRDRWGDDDPRAYLGITAPGFPNLFMLYGPNTNLGHGGSIIFHAECQIHYIMQALREMLEDGIDSLECRQEPHDAYNVKVDAAHRNMVWSHGGVGNWYKNARGRVIANSPWRLVDYWAFTQAFSRADFVVRYADG
jgi:4-hydroxyacetophenone monooxygenase